MNLLLAHLAGTPHAHEIDVIIVIIPCLILAFWMLANLMLDTEGN